MLFTLEAHALRLNILAIKKTTSSVKGSTYDVVHSITLTQKNFAPLLLLLQALRRQFLPVYFQLQVA